MSMSAFGVRHPARLRFLASLATSGQQLPIVVVAMQDQAKPLFGDRQL
jgi:hypothetical protein